MFEDSRSVKADELSCDKLLQAIDFFSQSLHLEQLSYYGFELVHEMLGLDRSCLFIREGQSYLLKYEKNYDLSQWSIPETPQLKKVATLFGRIMTAEQKEYFSVADLEAFSARIVIPLIIKDQLVGFIFSNGRKDGGFSEALLILAGALMQLMNRAYENAMNFLELEQKNYELDKKIFNLFFINHCSRTLLAELSLDKIYGICIDIIRELTASSVTSFGLYDETRDCIVIKGYQDILTYRSYYGEFRLLPDSPIPKRIVFHVEKDREALAGFFEDVDALKALHAEYIVMLVKDKILGFVSIGAPVSDRVYDPTLFELIETIATSIYISIENAQYFEKITQQNEAIQKKFETLEKMNRIIRNINSCESLEELCAIAMQSLAIGYGVKKGFLCLYDEGKLHVLGDIRIPHFNGALFQAADQLKALDDSGVYYEFSPQGIKKYFPEFEPERHGDANCLVIAPIRIDRMALGDQGILGYLVVFETEQALKEEEVLLIDTLANSIAPIVFQMNEMKRIQARYIEDPEQLLREDLQEKLENRERYFIDFKVWYRQVPCKPFEKRDPAQYTEHPAYLIGNWLFCPLEGEQEPEDFDGSMVILDMADFFKQVASL